MTVEITKNEVTCSICGVQNEQGLYHSSSDWLCGDCLLQIATPEDGDIIIDGVIKVKRSPDE